MIEWFRREAIYLWYYLDIQVRQIAPYWALGILLGSAVSVFGKGLSTPPSPESVSTGWAGWA